MAAALLASVGETLIQSAIAKTVPFASSPHSDMQRRLAVIFRSGGVVLFGGRFHTKRPRLRGGKGRGRWPAGVLDEHLCAGFPAE